MVDLTLVERGASRIRMLAKVAEDVLHLVRC